MNFIPGHEKAYWSKHRKSICDELEPISIVDDPTEDEPDPLRASIILSKTPSDSSLSVSSASSSDDENDVKDYSRRHCDVSGVDEKRKRTRTLDRAAKAKSLTSLKLEGKELFAIDKQSSRFFIQLLLKNGQKCFVGIKKFSYNFNSFF